MIRWTGLAPWEFEFPFPGSRTSTFLVGRSHLRAHPPSRSRRPAMQSISCLTPGSDCARPRLLGRALELPQVPTARLHPRAAPRLPRGGLLPSAHRLLTVSKGLPRGCILLLRGLLPEPSRAFQNLPEPRSPRSRPQRVLQGAGRAPRSRSRPPLHSLGRLAGRRRGGRVCCASGRSR